MGILGNLTQKSNPYIYSGELFNGLTFMNVAGNLILITVGTLIIIYVNLYL